MSQIITFPGKFKRLPPELREEVKELAEKVAMYFQQVASIDNQLKQVLITREIGKGMGRAGEPQVQAAGQQATGLEEALNVAYTQLAELLEFDLEALGIEGGKSDGNQNAG